MNALESDAGTYICITTNAKRPSSKRVTLTVRGMLFTVHILTISLQFCNSNNTQDITYILYCNALCIIIHNDNSHVTIVYNIVFCNILSIIIHNDNVYTTSSTV